MESKTLLLGCDDTILAASLNDLLLLHLCQCNLSIMLKDAFTLRAPFKVLATYTFALGVTRDSSLKALTILLKTFALFAVATFCMAVLAILTDHV